MRALGFLFIIVLLLAVVGYFRGWFTIATAHAGGNSDIAVGFDHDKIRDDTSKAASEMTRLSAKAAAAVRSLGTDVGGEQTELEGMLKTVDRDTREVTLTAGSQMLALHVASGVAITRDGEPIAFEELRPATPVKLTFQHSGEERSLSRIELLN